MRRSGVVPSLLACALLIGLAEFATPPPSVAATAGLVAAYGFDEGSGTTVADASGNGNKGTISNATWAASGKFGKALQFNGTNALVTVPNAGVAAAFERHDAGGVGQPLHRERQLA